MKIKEIQHVTNHEMLVVFFLMVLTFMSYGHFAVPIFVSENVSTDQIKAEILAYQAAQIFLLKNVEKQARPSRSLASENSYFEGSIGEDSSGRPFRFRVTQEGSHDYRVWISKDSEGSAGLPQSVFDLKLDLSEQPSSKEI